MPARSRRERLARLERVLLSKERWSDALLEVRAHTGKVLFRVGGYWDGWLHRFVDPPTDHAVAAHVVTLMESQLEIGQAIATYIAKRLAGDDSRPALLLAIGNRGGGKTFICALLMVALGLALPGSWQMGVSITSKQNREIKQAIRLIARPEWIADDITDFRDPRTELVTGGKLLWLTSKNPRALRQALLSFENILINEGQDQREVIFTNAISAIRNTGGVVSIATNPPQDLSGAGDWVAVLHQGIEAGCEDGQAFELDSAKNAAVNQPALGKAGRLLRMVNPDAADADADGLIKLAGNLGYPGFSRIPRREDAAGKWAAGHIGKPPEIAPPGLAWTDVTRQITAEHTKTEAGFDYVAGGDFQTDPGSCAAVGKLYRTPAGELVLAIREFVGTQGTEQDLTMALTARGYFPGPVDYEGRPAASLMLVGDATGARQNAEHRKRDPYSFTRLRADGWTVLPPAYYGPKRTPWNPLVPDSRKQMKACFLAGQILLAPECAETGTGFPSLIESFARAKVNSNGRFEKKGHFTHGPDGVRYLAWRFLPRPQPPRPDQSFNREAFDALRSVKIFGS